MALAEAQSLVFDRDSVTWSDWKPEIVERMAEMKQGYEQLEALELRCKVLVDGLNDNLNQTWIHDDGVEGVLENGERKVAFINPSPTEGLSSPPRVDAMARQGPEICSGRSTRPPTMVRESGQLNPGRPRKRKVFKFCFKRRHFKCWCTCFR